MHENSRKGLEVAMAELQTDNRWLREKNGKLAKAQVLLKEMPQEHEISRKELDALVTNFRRRRKLSDENVEYHKSPILTTELVEEHERWIQEQELVVATQREEINMLHREHH